MLGTFSYSYPAGFQAKIYFSILRLAVHDKGTSESYVFQPPMYSSSHNFSSITNYNTSLEQRPAETDIDRLGLRVVGQRRLAQLAPDTTLLVPAKR